jgi:sialic acid synthase SpsE
MEPAFIIAEIGSNLFKFNDPPKDLNCARTQIELAAAAGADAVKFQLFTAAELWGPEAEGTPAALELDRFALPREWLGILADHCEQNGIEFMCSAFSVGGYQAVNPHVEMHKIASPEVTDPQIRDCVIETGKPFLWSDGCSTALAGKGIRLACVSKYPAYEGDYDLTDPAYTGVWGLSDHTRSTGVAIEARKAGARYFEKHVDFCKSVGQSTPDTLVSVDGDFFKRWVDLIRCADDPQRQEAAQKYGRVEKNGAYYRPFPG